MFLVEELQSLGQQVVPAALDAFVGEAVLLHRLRDALGAPAYADVEEASSTVELREEITAPDPHRADAYQDYYEVYRSLYPATSAAPSRLWELSAGEDDEGF